MSASHEEQKHGGQTDPEATTPPRPCVCKELRPTLCLSQDDFPSEQMWGLSSSWGSPRKDLEGGRSPGSNILPRWGCPQTTVSAAGGPARGEPRAQKRPAGQGSVAVWHWSLIDEATVAPGLLCCVNPGVLWPLRLSFLPCKPVMQTATCQRWRRDRKKKCLPVQKALSPAPGCLMNGSCQHPSWLREPGP